MHNVTFRPFDEADWQMYSGAEGEPEIAYLEAKLDGVLYDTAIVVTEVGLTIDFLSKDDGTNYDFAYNCDTMEAAKAMVANLADEFTTAGLLSLGFVLNLF